jgi:multidrug efflux pump subunit AcrB
MEGGYAAIYETPNYQKLRRLVVWAVEQKFLVAGIVVSIFFISVFGMGFVKQQFFPSSDRPEVLVDVTLPQGSSIEATEAAVVKIEKWLKTQPEAKIVSSYIGGGAHRFWLAYNPELPDPNFAKMIILTDDAKQRDKLIVRLRQQVAAGLAPEARVRAVRFVFGPYTPWPVAFRVMGPDPQLYGHSQIKCWQKYRPILTCGRPTRIGRNGHLSCISFSTRTGCASSAFHRMTRESRFNF